ncbi:hypothetical protein [Streptomyces sp. NPDC051569]|uniref:hypothetical protein n=1 Tax=Streptomyces sp. NPDC051569 TaxID=3365661 RepID=UPI0037AF2CEE
MVHPDLVASLSQVLADIERRLSALHHNRDVIRHYIAQAGSAPSPVGIQAVPSGSAGVR